VGQRRRLKNKKEGRESKKRVQTQKKQKGGIGGGKAFLVKDLGPFPRKGGKSVTGSSWLERISN